MKILLPVFLGLTFSLPAQPQATNEGIFARDRLNYVLGQDGVTPIPVKLKSGVEVFLWTFGDTILGEWKGAVNATATLNFSDVADMRAMPPNSLALSAVPNDSNYKELKFEYFKSSGTVSEFIPYAPDEKPSAVRLWADDGIALGDAVYVYYMRVELTGEKTFLPFKFKETGLVKWDISRGLDIGRADFKRIPGFSIKDIVAGDAVLTGPDGFIYILGRGSKEKGGGLSSVCFLRVKPADIEKAEAYEFLTTSGAWAGGERGLFLDDVGGEASLSYDKARKEYTMVYMSAKTQEINLVTFKDFAAFPERRKTTTVHKPAPKKDAFYYSAKEIFRTKKFIYIIYIDQPILIKVSRP
jgi:hypothetical protein